jgi:hypothetical protein
VKRLAAYHAFLLAIPSLDLVLTPNGFGIVSNSNVAPASKERVERLMAIVEKQRDDTIELYLKYTFMYYNTQWASTRQGRYITATLFPNINLCDRCGITEHRWEKYKQLREQLVTIETKLAKEFFSPEQMATFRRQIPYWIFDKPNTLQTQVIEAIRNLEVSLLTGLQPHPQQFRDIVNIMRNSPNYFSDWANSDTAKLFAPELFINKKSSAGYWF